MTTDTFLFMKLAVLGVLFIMMASYVTGPMCFGCGGIELADEDMAPAEQRALEERMERKMAAAVEHMIYLTVGLLVAVMGGNWVWRYIEVDDP